ncbi:MAG: DUF4012 domain-containing protein [Anaerolineae bacterium]|nr:DUF4012 domain-containing protein [Anaerolineae bacterium]
MLLIGLALLLWLGVKGWRMGRAINSLLAQRETAELLMANGLTNIDPDQAEDLVLTVRRDFVILRDETAFVHPLLPHLGWVPQAGPLLVSSPQLLEMADAGTETAVHAVTALKPILLLLQSDQAGAASLPQLVHALDEARPGLAQASQSFDRVAHARANIENLDQFPQQIQSLFARADEWLPIGQDSLTVVQILPDILGVDGRRHYLLLAQNEDEIRATGGFISGLGLLTVEDGDIHELTFQDASTFDNVNLRENSASYGFPPKPLYELMKLDYFLMRDANYWPDFPYSAQAAIDLYLKVAPETQIDGVIAIDQEFMSLLVAATGPVTIPQTGQTITAQNTVESFRSAFNIQEGQTVAEWIGNRKAFLTTFASAILTKVQSDFGSVDPIVFTQNIHAALASRHLQLYMLDANEQATLDALNWDGRLEDPAGQDFLLVLDTNMGFNKTNMHVARSITYDVALAAAGTAVADLTISYTHATPAADGLPCEQGISYVNAPTYEEIADRCYFNFLRVYTPPGTALQDATTHFIPGDILVSTVPWNQPAETINEFANFTTFTNFMMVPRGDSLTTSFTYELPTRVVRAENGRNIYQLWLRQQAGTVGDPVSASVTLPPGAALVKTSASQEAQINQSGSTVNFQLDLHEDTLLTVIFEDTADE